MSSDPKHLQLEILKTGAKNNMFALPGQLFGFSGTPVFEENATRVQSGLGPTPWWAVASLADATREFNRFHHRNTFEQS